MNTPMARSPRLLLAATVVLALAGVVLLVLPHRPGTASATALPLADGAVHASSASSGSSGSARTSAVPPTTPTAAPTGAPSASVLPPHGEGVAGDRAIQRSLEAAWPADLDASDERQLLAAGRDLLRADATGTGRSRWPGFFSDDPEQVLAPAFAAARFRVQAVIARQDGARDRAVVHLVWAGTDRGGTYTDGRITDLHFTRTTPRKDGGVTWIPRPPT